MNDPVVIAPNLKRRLSGVTATIARVVPLQAQSIAIRATGPGLPANTPHIPLWRVILLPHRTRRVWHARRNTEMLLGLVLKYVFRKNLKLVFTSASQRQHSSYTRALIGKMDKLIATSAKGAAYLRHPSTVIHHGIDTKTFQPSVSGGPKAHLGLPQNRRLVGCFGRIRAQKGTDVFVNALIQAAQKYPDVTGVVLGRATNKHRAFEQDLKDRVARAGLSDRILFCGEASVDDMAQWYQCLDLFVAPQRWEGFGLTPLEAMACGVPVLTTKVGAFEELVIPGKTGELIAPDDQNAMTETLIRILENPSKLNDWSERARRHVCSSFSLETEANDLLKIYQDLLSTPPTTTPQA